MFCLNACLFSICLRLEETREGAVSPGTRIKMVVNHHVVLGAEPGSSAVIVTGVSPNMTTVLVGQ